MNKVEIKGNKILLRSTDTSDIYKIIKLEEKNKQFVHSYSKEKHIELISNDDCLHLSIIDLVDSALIGHMIVFGLTSENNVLEFRRLTINRKGKGFGREAVQLLKKFCFESLNFHRLWLDVYGDNIRAINLYESEGFKKEGILRECIKVKGGYRSQRIYSILESEFIRKESDLIT